MKTVRFRWLIVTKLLFLIFLGASLGCYSQSDTQNKQESDTVYVFFERAGNKILKVGGKVYNRPELSYPRDISREYVIKMSKLCTTCSQAQRIENVSVMLSHDAATDISFQMSRKAFLKEDFLDQNWFNSKSMEEIQSVLENKVILLVDQGYLYDENYILLKVDYYDFTQE